MDKSVADDQASEANDWRSVLKHWKIGFVVTLLSFGAACAVISQLTPYYKAYVQLLVPLKLVEDPGDRKGGAPQQADVFVVKSFTDLLTDNGIARRVIRDLNLTKSAEFQARPNWFTDQMAGLSKLLSSEDGSSVFSEDELTNDRILQIYEGRLKAVSESKDLTILLSFEAQDPRVAEQVVMAHARTFVQNEIDHRRKEFDAKVQWMRTELHRTAAEARDAQVAIQLNPTAMALSKSTSAAAVSDLKMRQLEATGTQAVYESVLKRYQDTVADQNYDGSEIRIVSEATLPTHPYFPKKLLSAAVAAVISIVFGFFAMGAASVTRRRISVDKLAEALGLPIVTYINAPGSMRSALGKKARSRRALFWQRIKEVRSVIDVNEKRHPITLVTSLMPKEGKSLVASALARSMAVSGSRTLLIDLNARNERYALSLDGRMSLLGLTEYLESTATAAQASIKVDSESPLFLMTDRRAEATDLTRLSSAKLKARFAALRKDYDAIVIDAPALESLSDAFCVAGYADEIFIAVQAGSQHLTRLQASIAKLRARSSRLKGVIVVDKRPADSDELASINGYTFRGCLNEIWPKAKRLTLAECVGFRRGRSAQDGKLNVNVEASI